MENESRNYPDLNKVKEFAASPAGRQLLDLLKQQNASSMQSAAQKAAQGDYSEAAKTAQKLLENPQIRALLEQMGG